MTKLTKKVKAAIAREIDKRSSKSSIELILSKALLAGLKTHIEETQHQN